MHDLLRLILVAVIYLAALNRDSLQNPAIRSNIAESLRPLSFLVTVCRGTSEKSERVQSNALKAESVAPQHADLT